MVLGTGEGDTQAASLAIERHFPGERSGGWSKRNLGSHRRPAAVCAPLRLLIAAFTCVAWGMDHHYGPYAGVPINLPASSSDAQSAGASFVSFYRWHLSDPVMFSEDLRVTLQQIGVGRSFKRSEEAAYAAYKAQHIAAGAGWLDDVKLTSDSLGFALVERADDYCATAFVYCRQPQPVPRLNTSAAVRDIGRLPSEPKSMWPDGDEWKRFSIEAKRRLVRGQ